MSGRGLRVELLYLKYGDQNFLFVLLVTLFSWLRAFQVSSALGVESQRSDLKQGSGSEPAVNLPWLKRCILCFAMNGNVQKIFMQKVLCFSNIKECLEIFPYMFLSKIRNENHVTFN